jgi:hypothetical protein
MVVHRKYSKAGLAPSDRVIMVETVGRHYRKLVAVVEEAVLLMQVQ